MPVRSSQNSPAKLKGASTENPENLAISLLIVPLKEILQSKSIREVRDKTEQLRDAIASARIGKNGRNNSTKIESVTTSDLEYLSDGLVKIEESLTMERAKYYAKGLLKSLTEPKTNGINDINLNRWKEYKEIETDSLWLFKKRDRSGSHLGWYWGNFVPQIPHQLILRYTKKGEWVLDPFAGSGTTLIEAQMLGRNALGVEINPLTVAKAREQISEVKGQHGTRAILKCGDSSRLNFRSLLDQNGIDSVQLLILHPPYSDIIKFSNESNDLSNLSDPTEFVDALSNVVGNAAKVLEDGRYMALVIGDKYEEGKWIPLGFLSMQEIMKMGFILRSIIVKNFDQTRGKRNQGELWRYRALKDGYYLFKHEYIFIFQRT
jgi:SAM-dependent methyltransferase